MTLQHGVHHRQESVEAPQPPHRPEELKGSPIGWAHLHAQGSRPDPKAYEPGAAASSFVRNALGTPQFFDSEKTAAAGHPVGADSRNGTLPLTQSGHRAQLNADGSGAYTVSAGDKLGSDLARGILQDRRKAAGVEGDPTAREIANFGNDLARLNGARWDRTLYEGKQIKIGPSTPEPADAKQHPREDGTGKGKKGEGDPHIENERKKEDQKNAEAPADREHQRELSSSKGKIEEILKKDPQDFKHTFEELDRMRKADKDGRHISKDLEEINKDLHEKGLLKKDQSIVIDDRNGKNGWAVVAEDHANPVVSKGLRNKTMVSTSHEAHESDTLKHHYSAMKYRRGHYNGWHQSVEGGGGAHGGFDKNAVGGHVPDGARKELIEKALQLAGVPVTEQNIAAVNKIVTRESGWNPNITNNWDSNAKAGHPSTGLMQTIPSTFKAFALPGMNNNIHDPLSNLVAGIRYAEHRYGRNGISGVARVASRPGGY